MAKTGKHPWFAWRPVQAVDSTGTSHIVWLVSVIRERRSTRSAHNWSIRDYWHYTLPSEPQRVGGSKRC